MKDSFIKGNIDLIINNSNAITFDIYLRLNEKKFIKLAHGEDDIQAVCTKYKDKGIKEVYVKEEEFSAFLAHLRSKITDKFFDDDSIAEEEKVYTLSQIFDVTRESLQKIGVGQIAIDTAQDLCTHSLGVLRQTPSLFRFFKDYSEKCSSSFLRTTLIGYTCEIIIDQMSWGTSKHKEKLFLAAFLSDMFLDAKEIVLMTEKEVVEGGKIFNHPITTSNYIKSKYPEVGRDVINIIEKHHEMPDGTGYPKGIMANIFTPLSAVFVVSQYFVEELIRIDFSNTLKDAIIDRLKLKFVAGPFKKPTEVLIKTFSQTENTSKKAS